MSQETAVAKIEPAQVPAVGGASWGSEGTDRTDMRVPRVRLAQGQSEYVQKGAASQGDIVRMSPFGVLAKKSEAVEMLFFGSYKTWRLFEKVGGKNVYRGEQPFTAENSQLPVDWEEKNEEGKVTVWRRDRVLNFYTLLPQDIAREVQAFAAVAKGEYPDSDDALLPCVVSFSRTSYGTGRDLITHFKKCEHLGAPPASQVFKLSSELTKNDFGIFHIFKIEKSRKTSPDELAAAKKWYNTLQSAVVRVEEETDDPTGEVASGVGNF